MRYGIKQRRYLRDLARTPQPEVRTIMPVKKKKVRKDSNKKKKQRQGKWPEITIIAGIIIFLLLIIWILI